MHSAAMKWVARSVEGFGRCGHVQETQSTMGRKLFAHDLAHELPGDWFFVEPDLGFQHLIDQSLVTLAGALRLRLEPLENRVIEIDCDAHLSGSKDYRTALAL
jgi:hypothetical protein